MLPFICAQVYTGSRSGAVTTVNDLSSIEVGHLVAVYCENYTCEPVIGQCIQISGSNVQIARMKGSYTTPWKLWLIRNGRKSVRWCDWIPKSSIILYDFELTSTKHLRKATIVHLKEAYEKFK